MTLSGSKPLHPLIRRRTSSGGTGLAMHLVMPRSRSLHCEAQEQRSPACDAPFLSASRPRYFDGVAALAPQICDTIYMKVALEPRPVGDPVADVDFGRCRQISGSWLLDFDPSRRDFDHVAKEFGTAPAEFQPGPGDSAMTAEHTV